MELFKFDPGDYQTSRNIAMNEYIGGEMINECVECGGERIEKLILYRCLDCGAEFTSELFGWVSVERRLPDKSGYVLVCKKGDKASTRAWFNVYGLPNSLNGKMEPFWRSGIAIYPDYWMPLPDPPK